jgi:hypothetical protein
MSAKQADIRSRRLAVRVAYDPLTWSRPHCTVADIELNPVIADPQPHGESERPAQPIGRRGSVGIRERRNDRVLWHHEALRALIVYLTNQDARLAYGRFRDAGFDVGSGQVESLCKQMAQRMTGSGMQWTPPGAQAVLSLRSQWLNDTWNDFWSNRAAA